MKNETLYKEMRGVMTRFEPLTAENVAQAASDGLTYEELKIALEQRGLRMERVVHDTSRRIVATFYADYALGIYEELRLSRKGLVHGGVLDAIAEQAKAGLSAQLKSGDFSGYYRIAVPLPMLIFDFEQRYREIPKGRVFEVWHEIYKRIDYANGMWPQNVLDHVFRYAPEPVAPDADADGTITIYRGMGELSDPPERALSWSTHPCNALWFAIHSGCGTRIAVAKIRPEQIVAYYPAYYNENEVIVRPGTVTEYRYEDMIPVTGDTIPPLLASALPDYIRYGRQATALGYAPEVLFEIHGLYHVLRVLLLSLIYFYHSGDALSEADKRIMIYFSLFHDIGRDNDDIDNTHGEKSVELIHAKGLRIHGLPMSKKEYRIAELLIRHHCRNDEVGETAIRGVSWMTVKEKANALQLYRICKDMDGLDRVRFNGLDYRMLRTTYGRRLPLVAGCLLEEQMDIFDDETVKAVEEGVMPMR